MSIGNIDWEREENVRNRPNQPRPEYSEVPKQPSRTSLLMRKMAQDAKNRMLQFHYGMLARKRANAMMKKQNPKRYAKVVAQRKARYDIMKTPNIFKNSGMKW